MQIIDVPQLSPEWYAARLGIPSASNFAKIVTTAGIPSKSREKYIFQLAGEYIIGKQEETYQNFAMLRGCELEAEARSLYEIINGVTVEQVGFCLTDGYGCSPDGLVGKDGMVQIKCPSLATHVEYLLDNELPSEYFQQVQGEMLVTGRKWNDFFSYYPGIKPFNIRAERDEKFIQSLEKELKLFCAELKETVNKIGDRNG